MAERADEGRPERLAARQVGEGGDPVVDGEVVQADRAGAGQEDDGGAAGARAVEEQALFPDFVQASEWGLV